VARGAEDRQHDDEDRQEHGNSADAERGRRDFDRNAGGVIERQEAARQAHQPGHVDAEQQPGRSGQPRQEQGLHGCNADDLPGAGPAAAQHRHFVAPVIHHQPGHEGQEGEQQQQQGHAERQQLHGELAALLLILVERACG